MYFVKTPGLFTHLFKGISWNIKGSDKLFLTFDDGPHPDSTPLLLDVLHAYNIKATFFCTGKNIEKHPDLFQLIIKAGHAVGSHGYNHQSGWKTDNETYISDVAKGKHLFKSNLFRPPYGKMTLGQYSFLKSVYHIVMWDVLPGDFDPEVSVDELYKRVITHSRKGSIIVLHDSPAAISRLLELIPKLAHHYKDFGKIES